MSVPLDIAITSDERELVRFGELASRSLGFPIDRVPRVLARLGGRNVRVARRGGHLVGGLGLLPMGHWFGGRSVSCVGITAVSVAPEHRSRGIASEMMRAVLEEARREGVALSSLYPATFPVYRAAGYESAGNRIVYRLTLSSLGSGARTPELRETSDRSVVRALYDARARTLSGAIDRGEYIWTRIFEPWDDDARAYVVEGDAGPEGYAVVSYRPVASPLAPNEIPVRDIVARTPAAGRRILRLLADHRSVARTATLAAGPGDPFLLLAREERLEIAEMQRWMLRIVDVRSALERRGWSPAVRAEVHFEVRDELLPENAGRWVLEVAGGRAEVRSGGSGAVAIDVRGLAALYSGFLSAEELGSSGLCAGDAMALATASSAFAGPAPWAADFF
jgi:predicted acetyltransferase